MSRCSHGEHHGILQVSFIAANETWDAYLCRIEDALQMAFSISVVVPVYNGELTLPDLVRRLEPVLRVLAREYEIVLVNDGSRDQSWAIIQRLAAENLRVRGINLMRNYGQHNALLCGIRAARCDTVVALDDDLQHAPDDLTINPIIKARSQPKFISWI
jgi:glycosyltransferase involved in cell wall biosynthesis